MRLYPRATLDRFLEELKNGSSGLEGYLRETGREEVTDMEVFDTYRVIGCQTVEMWVISIHRMVGGVCSEAEKLAGAVLLGDVKDD